MEGDKCMSLFPLLATDGHGADNYNNDLPSAQDEEVSVPVVLPSGCSRTCIVPASCHVAILCATLRRFLCLQDSYYV